MECRAAAASSGCGSTVADQSFPFQVGGSPRWSVRSPLDPASSFRRWALKERRGSVILRVHWDAASALQAMAYWATYSPGPTPMMTTSQVSVWSLKTAS